MWGLLVLYFIVKYHIPTSKMLYNISGENIFALKKNMLYTCSHPSGQMGTLIDNLSAKEIIIDL